MRDARRDVRDRFFSAEGAHGYSAFVDWKPMRFHGYVEGYWRAAVFTVQSSERHDLDRIVYPVVYCLRQYLELALKDLIGTAHRLSGEQSTFPQTHSLDALWGELKGILRKVDPHTVRQLGDVADCVAAFHEVDPSGEAFRYPQLHNGSDSLGTIQTINVARLLEQMEPVHLTLDVLDTHLSHQLDLQEEIAWAYGEY